MIQLRLFRKHYLTLAGVVLAFILIGVVTNRLLIQFNDHHHDRAPPIFFARLIDEMNRSDRVAALRKIEELNQGEIPFNFTILDADGRAIYPPDRPVPPPLGSNGLPQKSYEFVEVGGSEPPPPPAPSMFDLFGGSSGRASPPRDKIGIIRFEGPPVQYLLIEETFRPHGPPPARFMILSTALTLVSILLGIGCALYLLYRSLGKRVAVADQVITELQNGNLKARFPIRKRDEFKDAMLRFNQMADEIEHLVERLQKAESSRMILLQELAHDLRTPIASLKNLLETLQSKRQGLKPEIQQELLDLSVKETTYFESLVEDLLILAQVSEPRYQAKSDPLALPEIIEEEIDAIRTRSRSGLGKITIRSERPDREIQVTGNRLLLHRLFKNVIENAYSFAKGEVRVTSDLLPTSVRILVDDDGPGFTAEALAAYGIRRLTRTLGNAESEAGRITVGLGSVIAKAIVDAHRGQLLAENRVDATGRIQGARIRIDLPL